MVDIYYLDIQFEFSWGGLCIWEIYMTCMKLICFIYCSIHWSMAYSLFPLSSDGLVSCLPPIPFSLSLSHTYTHTHTHTHSFIYWSHIHTHVQSQSPTTRASRMFPVRRSTVVVHGGEELVIRKLVLAGILSAEKSYLDCLSVIKEVSTVCAH